MADPTPLWPWCEQPGMARSTALEVDEVKFGDGYKHRATRGLNPARATWTLSFPFTTLAELDERDQFLRANATNGFWMKPADATDFVFVTADEWSASITDRNRAGIIGTLSVTLVQGFNPQGAG